MITKRKPAKSSNPASVSIRINGRAVAHAAGAKLAAESLGCTQTTGPQAGRGSVLQMVEAIGAGRVIQQIAITNDPKRLQEISDQISIIKHHDFLDNDTFEVLRQLTTALRNAARLRETSET